MMVGCQSLLPTGSLQPNDRVVVFVDNEAVLSRLISGRGGGTIDNRIFQNILTWECDASICAWYERVPSSANVADAPSRGDVSGLCPECKIDICISSVLDTLLGN